MQPTDRDAAATRPAEPDVLDTPEAGPAAIRGSVLRTAAYVAGVLLSVASATLLVRHLGVVDFGRYVTVNSLVLLAGGLTEAGLTAIGVREYSVREGAERQRLIRNLLGLRLLLTTVTAVVATGFALLAGYPSAMVLGTAIGGAAFVLQIYQGTLAIPLQSELRLGLVSALEFLRQALMVVFIVGLVAAGASLLPFLTIVLPVSIIVLALNAVAVRDHVPLVPSWEAAEWRALLRDVLPYAAATAISNAYFRLTIVLMSLVASDVQTGYFATAYRIMEVLVWVPNLLVQSAFPVLARAGRDDRARLQYSIQRMLEVAVIGGVWLALTVALGAPIAIHVIAGDESDPSIGVLRIQAIALVATFIAVTCQYGLLALRRHWSLVVANALALVTGAALVLSLAPGEGAQGAAFATVGAETMLAAAAAWLLLRPGSGLKFAPGVVPKVIAAAGLAVAAAVLPGFPALVQVVVATVVYFGVLFALRGVPSEVLDAFARRTNQPSS